MDEQLQRYNAIKQEVEKNKEEKLRLGIEIKNTQEDLKKIQDKVKEFGIEDMKDLPRIIEEKSAAIDAKLSELESKLKGEQ